MNSKSKQNAAWNTARDMQELREEKWNLEITKPRKDVKEKKNKKKKGRLRRTLDMQQKDGNAGKKRKAMGKARRAE